LGYQWPHMLASVALFLLLIYVYAFNRSTPSHKVYLAFQFLIFLWAAGQFVAASTGDPLMQLRFLQLAFGSFCLLGPGWHLLVQFHLRRGSQPPPGKLAALLLPAFGCAAIVFWNPQGAFLSPVGGHYALREYGSLFWAVVAAQLVYFAAALSDLIRFLRTGPPSRKRNHLLFLLAGMLLFAGFAAIDVLINIVFQEHAPVLPGWTSLGGLLTALCLTAAIRRLDASDVLSLARLDIFEHIGMGILVLDDEGRVLEANRGIRPFVHVNVGERFDLEKFLAPLKTQGEVSEFLYRYRHYPQERLRTEITTRAGSVHHIAIHITPIMESPKSVIGRVIMFHDVTDMRKLVDEMNRKNEALHERNLELIKIQEELYRVNRKLEWMAITDSLTGCYNRRYLMQQLEKEVAGRAGCHRPFSIMLFDIDHFKHINDRYGHLVGDQVLVATVHALRGALRPTDLLARYGGEEFTVYLRETGRDEAEEVARRLMRAIPQVTVDTGTGTATIRVTISVGIATAEPFDGQAEDEVREYLRNLFARADAALYRAKNGGRNRVVTAD